MLCREAVQFSRRLALAALIAFVPYWSAYLPLALLLVVQLATLAQHSARPFIRNVDNHCEIASLTLLSANYLTGACSRCLSFALCRLSR